MIVYYDFQARARRAVWCVDCRAAHCGACSLASHDATAPDEGSAEAEAETLNPETGNLHLAETRQNTETTI